MKTDAIALIEILRSEKESYQELLDLSKREQQQIINRDVENLISTVKAMEKLMLTVRDLEKKRLVLVNADSGQGSPHTPPELSSIAKYLNEPLAKEASELKDELLLLIKDLGKTNQTNAELLKRSLGYIDFLLGAIAPEENPVYSNKPGSQGSTIRLFDGRA